MGDLDDDAMLLGVSPAEFAGRIGVPPDDFPRSSGAAADRGAAVFAPHRQLVLVPPWGWAELSVHAPFDYRIEAVGVVPPGIAVCPEVIQAHRPSFWNSRGLPLTAAGLGAAGAAAAPVVLGAHPGLTTASMGFGALMGAGSGLRLSRRYRWLREATRRLEISSSEGDAVVGMIRLFMHIRHVVEAFDEVGDRLVPLRSSPGPVLELGLPTQAVLLAVHRCIWQAITGEGVPASTALDVVGEVSRRVEAAADDALALHLASRVMDVGEPLQTSRRGQTTSVRELIEAVDSMDHAAAGRRLALSQLRRLNGHDVPNPADGEPTT